MILLVHSEKNSIDTIAMFNYRISEYTKQRRCKGSDGSSWDLLDVSGLVFFFFLCYSQIHDFQVFASSTYGMFPNFKALESKLCNHKSLYNPTPWDSCSYLFSSLIYLIVLSLWLKWNLFSDTQDEFPKDWICCTVAICKVIPSGNMNKKGK